MSNYGIKRIKHRVDRINKKLKRYNIDNPHEVFNYFGGWGAGYLEGQKSILEDIIDELEENNETTNNN